MPNDLAPADPAPPDAALLDGYVRRRDEAAFAAILRRHGPLVYDVCRRLLHDPHDTADAFQATFLVLVRKADAIRRGALLGNWLYGVALRVAGRARHDRLRRQARVRLDPALDLARPEPAGDALAATLHEEVQRLPDRYRSAVVLCYFEGKSIDEAARELACPGTTVKGRLQQARELLRKRLARRGVALTAGLLAAHTLAAPVPAALVATAAQAAVAPAALSPHVVALSTGVIRAMVLTKLKSVAAAALAVAIVLGAGGVAYHNLAARPAKEEKKPKADAEAILGSWKVTAIEYDGKKNPEGAEFDVLRKFKVTFTKDKQLMELDGRAKEYTYKLDPKQKPKTLDLEGDVSVTGIYELADGKLKLCMPNAGKGGGERPKEMAAKAGDGRILLVLEREKKE